MIRVSRAELAERWALTYTQDGYDVQPSTCPADVFPGPPAAWCPIWRPLRGTSGCWFTSSTRPKLSTT